MENEWPDRQGRSGGLFGLDLAYAVSTKPAPVAGFAFSAEIFLRLFSMLGNHQHYSDINNLSAGLAVKLFNLKK